MKNLILLALLMTPGLSLAAEIDAISGHYTYDAYQLTLPSGKALSLAGLGVQSAVIDILPSMKEVMIMTMRDGTRVKTEATILDVHVHGARGHFFAQWPDMKAPVKEEFKLTEGGMSYVIHFTNPADSAQYGSKEEATLRRLSR